MYLIKIKTAPENISDNFAIWLKRLKGQLAFALQGLRDEDAVNGTATLELHPGASKYAFMAIEVSGFEILSQTA